MLQRVQAAPWLQIKLSCLSPKWTFTYYNPPPALLVKSLQKHLEVATAASRGLGDLKLLVRYHLGHFTETSPSPPVTKPLAWENLLQPWLQIPSSLRSSAHLSLYAV